MSEATAVVERAVGEREQEAEAHGERRGPGAPPPYPGNPGAVSAPRAETGRTDDMRREITVNIAGAVLGAAIVGAAGFVLAWGIGLSGSVGDLDARTRALDAGFEQTRALIQQNAAQIGSLGQKIEALATSAAGQNAELRRTVEALATSTAARLDQLAASVDRLVRDSAEQRQTARDDMRELRDAIRDLAGQQRREGGAESPP
jgi:hypothetical protein